MIRAYRAADEQQVLEVWYRAAVIAHSFLPDEVLSAERQQIKERWLPVSETLVYVCDRRVAGFLSMLGNEVGGLFVDPDYQQRGIGRALLDEARKARSVLELSVFAENRRGQLFYLAYGFEVVGRQTNQETGRAELRLRLSSE